MKIEHPSNRKMLAILLCVMMVMTMSAFTTTSVQAADAPPATDDIVAPKFPQSRITIDFWYSDIFAFIYPLYLENGDTPITWSIIDGEVPLGLGVSGNPASIEADAILIFDFVNINGPTTAGIYVFTIKAENAAGFDMLEVTMITNGGVQPPTSQPPTTELTTAPTSEESMTDAPPTSAPPSEELTTDVPLTSTPTSAPTTAPLQYNSYKLGDVNFDDKVDLKDVLLTQKHVAKIVSLDDLQKLVGDVSPDGKIDLKDVLMIQKFVVKITTTMGTDILVPITNRYIICVNIAY